MVVVILRFCMNTLRRTTSSRGAGTQAKGVNQHRAVKNSLVDCCKRGSTAERDALDPAVVGRQGRVGRKRKRIVERIEADDMGWAQNRIAHAKKKE
jgi:hypothetical protein